MSDRRYRVLLVCSHPVQYASPAFRQMAQHPKLDIQVAYCSLQGAERGLDREFGVQLKWDVPLLEGYPWVAVPNKSPWPGLQRFVGLLNPGLVKLVRTGGFDAVVAYIGYAYLSSWLVFLSCRMTGKPLLLTLDATSAASLDHSRLKQSLKRVVLPCIFQLVDTIVASSSATVEFLKTLGVSSDRVFLGRPSVDNDYWAQKAEHSDRGAIRAQWGIPDARSVILFCAKLQPWKRPHDLLRAFAKAQVPGSYLIYAGDGPLRSDLEAEAKSMGVSARVKFLGFVNQSMLPGVYATSDLLVLPSEFETFGFVVNEAMLCGCVPVVSDRVGAGYDLISDRETGFRFTCGDIEELATLIQSLLTCPDRLAAIRHAAGERVKAWAPQDNIETLLQAIEWAVGRHTNSNTCCAKQGNSTSGVI